MLDRDIWYSINSTAKEILTLALISFVEKEEPNPSGNITSTDPASALSSFPILIRIAFLAKPLFF